MIFLFRWFLPLVFVLVGATGFLMPPDVQSLWDRGEQDWEEEYKLDVDLPVVRKMAEQGDAKAQTTLGMLYFSSDMVPQDNEKALHWLHKAAAQEAVSAQFLLGMIYFEEKRDLHDEKKALHWLRKAAEKNHAYANFILGFRYIENQRISKRKKEAMRYFRKALTYGDSGMQLQIGFLFGMSEQVPSDPVFAYAALTLAARNDKMMTVLLREELSLQMTPQQISEAEKLVREIRKDMPAKE